MVRPGPALRQRRGREEGLGLDPGGALSPTLNLSFEALMSYPKSFGAWAGFRVTASRHFARAP